MKRIICYFILISLILCSSHALFAQETASGNVEHDQASNIANQLALQKTSTEEHSLENISMDVSGLIDLGYEAWANLEFERARGYFHRALSLEPNNPDISNLVYEIERAKLEYERNQAEIEKDILEQKRVLEMDKAWLTEAPETTVATAKSRKSALNKLKMQAARKKVSVDFSDAEISKIINYLSKVSKINIIMDEAAVKAAGSISITLKKVTLSQALESILRTKGLGYRFEDDFIWVSSKENIANELLITRIYHLSQGLATFTSFTTFDTVTIEGLRGDNKVVLAKEEGAEDAEEADSGVGPGVRTYEGVKIGGPSGVAGNVTKTIKDVLEQLVEWPEGSRMFLDSRTSTLIVRNTPTNLSVLEEVLEAVDVNPPQVMIEARFVEIGADDLFSLGLKLSTEISASGSSAATTFPFDKNQNGHYSDPFPFPTVDDYTFGTLDFTKFQAVLSAIESNTNSNTLSSPKITTISGQEAVIKIVKEFRYPTKYEIEVLNVQQANGESVTQSFPVPVEFTSRDIGIILKVTPNVGADEKTINLTLVPEVSEFDEDKDFFNYGTADRPFLQPFFNTRNATASIVVNNGDTVVMGGLMREVVSEGVERVPFLGQIPILGALFSRKTDNTQKRNLLIFVTARILAPTGETVRQ